MSAKAIAAVQKYAEEGGRVIALGMGVSVGARKSIVNELQLYDPRSRKYAFLTTPPVYEPHPANVRLQSGSVISGLSPSGAAFAVGSTPINVLGLWDHTEQTTDLSEGQEAPAAGLYLDIGHGRLAVWNVALGLESGVDAQGSPAHHELLRNALSWLGLSLPTKTSESSTQIHTQRKNQLSKSVHPLPQFLLSPPSKPSIVQTVLSSLAVSRPETLSHPPSLDEPAHVHRDAADTFNFYFASGEDALRLTEQARTDVNESKDGQPKPVIVLQPGETPPSAATPEFNAGKYFSMLAQMREKEGLSDDKEASGVGEALLYGEAVTSTQTMLDKYALVLTISALAGRGRGRNTWLSPRGCLQFSVLQRVSLTSFPAAHLVFIQYLFGLAVIAACRDERLLGPDIGRAVRLKWPNDIYIEHAGEKRKIGGILVNTSFSGGKVDIVIGCGLNLTSPPPIASLQLLAPGATHLDAETVLPVILAKFERMWRTFVDGRGSWAAFEDAYLDAWMHSDQLVTITSLTPPCAVRIVGITLDHGLLRTLPERSSWGARGDEGYIDLQPDGNSFDLMAGLIKAKT
ncbi:hypothetical protein EWM64_g1146 [Hericium alpestre]|uniref:BPL/LPL catalytic domain-containing protein n=1 Tax=Hericium alpestre TaxID=135208 RepID=A0A4Z0A9B6_9AGAM|nr:hypothetical protein EWM64_g1146 [Hericium alpestre]